MIRKIEWDHTFSVGVARLDEQHRVIINVINELIDHSRADVNSEFISEALDRLTQFASNHFRTEEALLSQHDYPQLAEQKKEHQEYRIKIVNFCLDTAIHQNAVPKELLEFLCKWWIEHILESDMAYKSFFNQAGVR